MKYPIFKSYGLQAVLLEWEPSISVKTNDKVLFFERCLHTNFGNFIIEMVPTYNSLAVYLKETVSLDEFVALIKNSDSSTSEISKKPRTVVYVPVCYHYTFGIDIRDVAKRNNLSIAEVIELHTTPTYPVYFIGFLPGFPYLGGLNKKLHINRREQPRNSVAAGSIAIGGNQTGIYPNNSPGGWNIIGRTPLELFSIDKSPTCLLNAGDRVQFYEISEAEYHAIKDDLKNKDYELRKEVIDD